MRKKTLMLHVGLPKTGSTTLQRWCYTNHDALAERGIEYPLVESRQPWLKQQFLVTDLLAGTFAVTGEIIDRPTQSSAMLLSAEGLTNHLYDFSEAALADFRALTRHCVTRVFIVIRDPARWIRSYYKQALINPPLDKYHHGTSLELDAFAALPRIQRLLNTPRLLADVAALYGAASVTPADYESDWFRCFLDFLGVPPDGLDRSLPGGTNESLPDVFTDLVRQINALGLPPAERAHCLCWIARTSEAGSDVLRGYQPLPPGDSRRITSEEALQSLIAGSAAEPLFQKAARAGREPA